MTRIDLQIDHLVLRGVPAEVAEGIGPLVEERLSELATADRRGATTPGWAVATPRRALPVSDRDDLAAHIARDVWASARAQIREGTSR